MMIPHCKTLESQKGTFTQNIICRETKFRINPNCFTWCCTPLHDTFTRSMIFVSNGVVRHHEAKIRINLNCVA
jgi:hypothetical protein